MLQSDVRAGRKERKKENRLSSISEKLRNRYGAVAGALNADAINI
jgi:hypothetical protein